MNNRIQQRFDRSIREAVRDAKAARDRRPTRDLTAIIKAVPAKRAAKPKGRLYLCPQTGATIWDPQS